MMKYYVEFRVQTTSLSGFPVDMLRYDSCWPRNSDDAATIHSIISGDHKGPAQIAMVKYARTKAQHGVTIERWRSFMCHVDPANIRVRPL